MRALGSRHSFTDIADSAELLTLDRIPAEIVVDSDAMTISCSGALRYGELAIELDRRGLALANLGSLPHLGIAGAVATATHGSGVANGNLATAVTALELVSSDGELIAAARGETHFAGLVVGLGALGVVTRVTLDVEPAYEVHQRVFERLSWEALFEHFETIMSSGYSVSVFTLWGAATHQVWVKQRVPDALPDELFGAMPATENVNPIPGLDPATCTQQLGLPGPWYERLPHFRMGFTPSSGAEIQSEYIVARRHAIAAVQALRAISATIRPLTQTSEIRAIAADNLWMSPQYGQDTVAIHFTWKRDQHAVERALVDVERALAPFEPRPHWGKLFLATGVGRLYERLGDFAALVDRLDRRGAFRNEWLATRVFG